MTLRSRMGLGFTIIVAVFVVMVGATMISLTAFQAEDRTLATNVAALTALRDAEVALLREEAALDGYIAAANAALKAEFEGPARVATDAALAAAAAVALSGHHQLDELHDRIIAWREKTGIDVLALARQTSTQAAKEAVHETLAAAVQAMQQEITAAQMRKGEMARRLVTIVWGATTAAFAVALAAAWWLTRTVQRPIVALTVMAGLACGEVSVLAWSVLDEGANGFISIQDESAAETMRILADGRFGDGPVVAGESAVAGLAAMLLAAGDPASRRLLKLDENSVVLVIGTEGATDPAVYGCIVGRSPESVFPGWTCGPKCEDDD